MYHTFIWSKDKIKDEKASFIFYCIWSFEEFVISMQGTAEVTGTPMG
jgi:hypothetical protein